MAYCCIRSFYTYTGWERNKVPMEMLELNTFDLFIWYLSTNYKPLFALREQC